MQFPFNKTSLYFRRIVMEAVRQVLNSTLLNGVISLPRGFQNRQVEVIVLLNDENTILPMSSRSYADTMVMDSVPEVFPGILTQADMPYQAYRAESIRENGYVH
jgi:hypothetical protein